MFAHLHTHTEYSELDGLSKIAALTARAKNLGQDSLAITDHGNLYGAIEFYRAATSEGLRPILGMEAYVAPGDRRDREAGREAANNASHLVLLAANNTGWRNLIQLSTRAHLEGFYYRPRVDRELLSEYSEGLIVLSGCPSSELQRALQVDDLEQAHRIAAWYRETFGDRYYLEIQRHEQLPQFEPALRHTVQMSQDLGIPLVATQDAHYCDPGDHDAHDLLLCIGTNSLRTDEKRFRFDGEDFYLTDEDYMTRLFADLPEAVSNTQLVAERCQVELEFDRLRLPQPDIPEGMTAQERLVELAWLGLEQRYGTPTAAHQDRLRYELHVIEETGFAEYFLIVMDFSQFARERGIAKAVRGSAAASLVLYCLGITDIDPIEYSLVFERFLNLERREMPDIDMDFADNRRDEVIRYVAEKYGRDRVAQIITFGTLGAKAAIRDSARALGIPLGETDRVARMVPNQLNISVADAISQSPELWTARDEDPLIAELLSYAERLNGVVRNTSTHAAGVVISQEPLAENVPLRRPVSESEGDDWIPMTQWGMDEVAAVGLLKMDFLGLTNLTILEEAVELELQQRRAESERPDQEEPIDYVSLPDGDEPTFSMLATGNTFGVFQLESGGMRRVVADLKPTSLRDLAALLALYRPGPMEHIPRFIESRHGRALVTYPHRDLGEILDDTYGVIVYQDQVLHIARKFAGYTLGQADVMRKAMGKKIAEVMQAERGNFVSGAVAQGYSERDAETIFELIEPFAGYAFNKAHAVSYAAIAYQTAWFKANHPAPYMAAVLRAASGNSDRVRAAAAECERLKIPLLSPDVNRSQQQFTLERTRTEQTDETITAIRFGLGTIKNVGMGAVEPLIAEREEHGPFQDFADLCDRIDARTLNRRALESLAKAGAFDEVRRERSRPEPVGRGPMVSAAEDILKRARRAQELRDSGQMSMFDLFGQEVSTPTPQVALSEELGATEQEQLHWERELLGAYVSQHPLQAAERALQDRVDAQLAELTEDMAGRTVTVAGLVNSVRRLTTRKGDTFCAVMLEDLSGSAELTVWPEQYRATTSIWEQNNIVVATVSIRARNDRLTIAVDRAEAWSEDTGPAALEAPPELPALPEPADPLPAPDPVPPPVSVTAAPLPPASQTTSARIPAPALWITIRESDDPAADRDLLERMENLLRGIPGEHAVFLRIQTVAGEEVVLACSEDWRVNASFATVNVVSSLLGVQGSAELGSTVATVPGAGAAAGG